MKQKIAMFALMALCFSFFVGNGSTKQPPGKEKTTKNAIYKYTLTPDAQHPQAYEQRCMAVAFESSTLPFEGFIQAAPATKVAPRKCCSAYHGFVRPIKQC